LQLFDQLPASGAMDAWERSQMQLALSLSLEENEASKKKKKRASKKLTNAWIKWASKENPCLEKERASLKLFATLPHYP
jgi:hypothetical protein